MLAPLTRTLKFKLPMLQGEDVRTLQLALSLRGLLHRSGVDGLFGPGTKRAVEAFQRQHGLTIDGIVGPNTYSALDTLVGASSEDFTSEPWKTVSEISGRTVPLDWMPNAKMKRIILHWTAGTHTPSNSEKKRYHILIDGKGGLHRGKHPISANVPPLSSGGYAAHTLNSNSHSIGLCLCAMGGDVREKPLKAGPFPITRAQWDAMARAAAELCLRYDIEVTRQTVLGHGEVQANLGIKQNGKWDPMAVEWDPGRPYLEVGDDIRSNVQGILDALRTPQTLTPMADAAEVVPAETVHLDGVPLRGAAFDGRVWLDLFELVTHNAWPTPVLFDDTASALIAFASPSEPSLRFGIVRTTDADGFERTWVEVPEVSERLGLILREDGHGDLHLETPAGAQEEVIVKRGQTLSTIALLHLGERSRWRELRREDGTLFDEESAKRLRVGEVVLLPDGTQASQPRPAPGTALKDPEIARIAKKISKLEGGGTKMQDLRAAAVKAILGSCVKNGVNDLSHQAYILATAYHETNLGQFMEEIWGPTAAQLTYGSRLGNRGDEEGKLYKGRGFVQITGRDNYQKYSSIFGENFIDNPQLVAAPAMAAEILVRGITEFGFTGKGLLSDMGLDGDFDWFNARGLINGDKNLTGDDRYPGQTKGHGIAQKAQQYRQIIALA